MPTEKTPDPASETTSSPTIEGEVPGFRPLKTRSRTADTPTTTLPADTPTIWDPATNESSSPDENPSTNRPPPRSSPGSTPDPEPPAPTANPEDLEELVGALVHLGLGTPALVLNERRAPGTTIWILDDQDVAGIAGPLARIAARRVPAVDGDTNDVIDGLLVTIGVGGYVMKNLSAERALKATRGGATLEAPGGQETAA